MIVCDPSTVRQPTSTSAPKLMPLLLALPSSDPKASVELTAVGTLQLGTILYTGCRANFCASVSMGSFAAGILLQGSILYRLQRKSCMPKCLYSGHQSSMDGKCVGFYAICAHASQCQTHYLASFNCQMRTEHHHLCLKGCNSLCLDQLTRFCTKAASRYALR